MSSRNSPRLPIGTGKSSLDRALEQRVAEDQDPPRVGRRIAAFVPGCAAVAFFGTTAVMLVAGKLTLGQRLGFAATSLPFLLGFGWLAWRWGRGLPPTDALGTPEDRARLRLDE